MYSVGRFWVLGPTPKATPTTCPKSIKKLRSVDIHSFKTNIKIAAGPTKSVVSILSTHYNKVLVSVLAKHAPIETNLVTVRPVHPWFLGELYDAKCKKRKCERR